LRWINAKRAKSVQIIIMDRLEKSQLPVAAQEAQPATDRRGATGQQLATVVAAWPAGVSVLAQAVEACQRRDTREAGTDLPPRGANSFVPPQAFCD
jgi:hypothetical protein